MGWGGVGWGAWEALVDIPKNADQLFTDLLYKTFFLTARVRHVHKSIILETEPEASLRMYQT